MGQQSVAMRQITMLCTPPPVGNLPVLRLDEAQQRLVGKDSSNDNACCRGREAAHVDHALRRPETEKGDEWPPHARRYVPAGARRAVDACERAKSCAQQHAECEAEISCPVRCIASGRRHVCTGMKYQ